jgi:DNA polymerase I-like protein with 3'-5' exonuclease and polymerase domains
MSKPQQDEDGNKLARIREVVVPSGPDRSILSMDMSSQELVHIAEQSQDPNMLACYTGEVRKDLHSLTGASIYKLRHRDIEYDEFIKIIDDKTHEEYSMVKKARAGGKGTNFLSAYLGQAPTLSIKQRVPLSEAELMLEAKNKAFPGVVDWQERMKVFIRTNGYSVEPMGRRRHVQLEGSWKDEHAIRGGINHVIQGGAGSQIKLIMGAIWKVALLDKLTQPAYFLFSVHDEVIFDIADCDMVEALKALHPVMTQQYANFGLQFESSIAIGKNFGELTELGTKIDEEKIKALLF